MSFEALQALVDECTPTSAITDLLVKGQTSFDYQSGGQAVHCTVARTTSSIRMVIAVADGPPRRAGTSPGAASQSAQVAPSRPTPPAAMAAAAPVAVTAVAGEPKINAMLRAMKQMGASDLHMSCTMPPLVRKDGEMKPVPGFDVLTPETHAEALVRDRAREEPQGVRRAQRHRLRARDRGPVALPRQHVPRPPRPGRRIPRDSRTRCCRPSSSACRPRCSSSAT